jgi:integrase
MAVAAARVEATRLAGNSVQGKSVRSRPQESRSEWTLQELFNWYFKTYSVPHKRTWKWDERNFINRFTPWANRRVSSITRMEVQHLHLSVGKKNGPYAANKALELLGHMYRMGFDFENAHVPCPDPTKGIKRYRREERERFLDADELPKFIKAVSELRLEISRDFMMLCLWTGARRANVCGMRWDDISLKTGVWIIPAADSKNKKPMNIALSPPAIEILKRRQASTSGPWVLPGGGPTGHYNDPKASIARVRDLSGLKDLRIHDLRRTLGSWMAVNTPLHIIGKQLGHASQKSTAIYARLANSTLKTAVDTAAEAMGNAGNKK